MNLSQRNSFKMHATTCLATLRFVIKFGTSQTKANKEHNYQEVKEVLDDVIANCGEADVTEAASILTGPNFLARDFEIAKPPAVVNVQALLTALDSDSTAVRATINGANVRLDNDQLKHQHPSVPIGTRQTHGGNQFKAYCDSQWHIDNTLPVMATWAGTLLNMKNGQKIMHGQIKAVDGIHYEGFCQNVNGVKYVLFHCYPDYGTDHFFRKAKSS